MPFKWLPNIETCCICIPSLRTAAAIIVVLALVTNPLLSWLMSQHSYALRVACLLSATDRIDVVDLKINNVISFGFGVNADLGVSCLTQSEEESGVVDTVIKVLGWIVLVADLAHLITSILFLVRIYRNPKRAFAIAFIITALVSIFFSVVYGIMYPTVCAIRGRGIALCQLLLTLVDLGSWTYFLLVILSYIEKLPANDSQGGDGTKGFTQTFIFGNTSGSKATGGPSTSSSANRGRPSTNPIYDCCQWIVNLFRKKMPAEGGALPK